MPTSRATRVTSSAKADSWSTIVLTVDLSWRISPWASTVIFLDRSPFATDVVTWAMFRTWDVRFDAMKFTLSVRSFQTPDTPRTWARPPSRPSVPTSRATRVTSSAKADSWSTIVLTVSFSSSSSPVASTVTERVRSPLATALVTTAMSRTCAVSRSAIMLTASVTSRQVPDRPRTLARPPRRPSVPTSRASRVTSPVNIASWSTIWLIRRPRRRRSPRSGRLPSCRSMRWVRSPSATASRTRVALAVGTTRASMRVFAASTLAVQAPWPGLAERRASRRPWRTTSRQTRVSSSVKCWFRSAIWLKARGQLGRDALAAGGQPKAEVAVAQRGHRRQQRRAARSYGPNLHRAERTPFHFMVVEPT